VFCAKPASHVPSLKFEITEIVSYHLQGGPKMAQFFIKININKYNRF